jgi:peroxiredoxin
MSLQAKLDAFKADFEAGKLPYSVPRSVIETMHRATAELIALVRQNKLGFPILSDVKGKVGAASGLRFNLQDYLIELYKGLKNDLPAFSDDPCWTLPMPGRFVIGQDGTLLYSEVNLDYTHWPEPEDMTLVLQRATAVAV